MRPPTMQRGGVLRHTRRSSVRVAPTGPTQVDVHHVEASASHDMPPTVTDSQGASCYMPTPAYPQQTQIPSSPSPPRIPISWPPDGALSCEWVFNLMHAFDWSSRYSLPSKFPSVFPEAVFNNLVCCASRILHKEPNCVKIDDICADSRVIVVGDIHGQLHDLMFLLDDAGYPGENNFFVFNGDYVDRGAWGLETFLLLLAWKVFMPHRVFLLRGNHESAFCTKQYGFKKEVLTKYGEVGAKVYKKCLKCFQELPLASLIAGKVYTAHGGLFRSLSDDPSKRGRGKRKQEIITNSGASTLSLGTLEELSNANRFFVDPPHEGRCDLIPGDVLWSDPSMTPGITKNERRGIGLLWGPDKTEEFLKKSDLKLIIRSHERPDAREKRKGLDGMGSGYSIDHDFEYGKLITIFSAPDYPQFQDTEERYNNKGAYIKLQPPDFNHVFQSFEAVHPRPVASAYYDFANAIDSDNELDLPPTETTQPKKRRKTTKADRANESRKSRK